MNRSVILPLLICGLLLAGCYRQSEEPFEQVNSQSVESIESPTSDVESTATEIDDPNAQQSDDNATADPNITPSKTPDPADVDPTDNPLTTPTVRIPSSDNTPLLSTATPIEIAASPTFITPQSAPGQTTPATTNPPTPTATFDIVQASPTSIEDGLQSGDECVHEVVGGDTLFRLAINNGTTVEAIQQRNSIEGDAIAVGQLLIIPGCVVGQADEPTATTPSLQATLRPTVTSSSGGSSVATLETTNNIPTAGQQIHVVVSGETLGVIANRYGTTVSELVELNDMTDPNALQIGDQILIPARN